MVSAQAAFFRLKLATTDRLAFPDAQDGVRVSERVRGRAVHGPVGLEEKSVDRVCDVRVKLPAGEVAVPSEVGLVAESFNLSGNLGGGIEGSDSGKVAEKENSSGALCNRKGGTTERDGTNGTAELARAVIFSGCSMAASKQICTRRRKGQTRQARGKAWRARLTTDPQSCLDAKGEEHEVRESLSIQIFMRADSPDTRSSLNSCILQDAGHVASEINEARRGLGVCGSS